MGEISGKTVKRSCHRRLFVAVFFTHCEYCNLLSAVVKDGDRQNRCKAAWKWKMIVPYKDVTTEAEPIKRPASFLLIEITGSVKAFEAPSPGSPIWCSLPHISCYLNTRWHIARLPIVCLNRFKCMPDAGYNMSHNNATFSRTSSTTLMWIIFCCEADNVILDVLSRRYFFCKGKTQLSIYFSISAKQTRVFFWSENVSPDV